MSDRSRDPEPALATMRLWCHDINADLVETLAVTDADRGGGAREREGLLRRAFDLGVAAAAGEPATQAQA